MVADLNNIIGNLDIVQSLAVKECLATNFLQRLGQINGVQIPRTVEGIFFESGNSVKNCIVASRVTCRIFDKCCFSFVVNNAVDVCINGVGFFHNDGCQTMASGKCACAKRGKACRNRNLLKPASHKGKCTKACELFGEINSCEAVGALECFPTNGAQLAIFCKSNRCQRCQEMLCKGSIANRDNRCGDCNRRKATACECALTNCCQFAVRSKRDRSHPQSVSKCTLLNFTNVCGNFDLLQSSTVIEHIFRNRRQSITELNTLQIEVLLKCRYTHCGYGIGNDDAFKFGVSKCKVADGLHIAKVDACKTHITKRIITDGKNRCGDSVFLAHTCGICHQRALGIVKEHAVFGCEVFVACTNSKGCEIGSTVECRTVDRYDTCR